MRVVGGRPALVGVRRPVAKDVVPDLAGVAFGVGDLIDPRTDTLVGDTHSIAVPILHLVQPAVAVEDDLLARLVGPRMPVRLGSVGFQRAVDRFGRDVAAGPVGHEREAVAVAGEPDFRTCLRIGAIFQPIAVRERPPFAHAPVRIEVEIAGVLGTVVACDLEREAKPGEVEVDLVVVDIAVGHVDGVADPSAGCARHGPIVGLRGHGCWTLVGRDAPLR